MEEGKGIKKVQVEKSGITKITSSITSLSPLQQSGGSRRERCIKLDFSEGLGFFCFVFWFVWQVVFLEGKLKPPRHTQRLHNGRNPRTLSFPSSWRYKEAGLFTKVLPFDLAGSPSPPFSSLKLIWPFSQPGSGNSHVLGIKYYSWNTDTCSVAYERSETNTTHSVTFLILRQYCTAIIAFKNGTRMHHNMQQ